MASSKPAKSIANVVAPYIEKNVLWFHVILESEDGPGVMVAYLLNTALFWTSSAQHQSGGRKHGANIEASKFSPIHVVLAPEHFQNRNSVTNQDTFLAVWVF